ncbi:hypothetical protein AB0L75_31940 [Streptomyces sp. NPDC052101]|uniref:hypothetical protein n=1 Tax=Streptomyces sp. NPDC052101 TaxID=3155763 RepID=UPI00344A9812
MTATDGDHSTIVSWLARRCMQTRPDLDLYQARGLRVDAYREGRAKPDAVLAPEAHFAGHGDWADPDGDRDSCTVTVHSGPDWQIGGCRDIHTAKFGEKVLIPGPMNIELDTEILKNYVR